MITTSNERLPFEVYKRVKNSAYEYEDHPSIMFKGRVASQIERKHYRIETGVNGNSDSIFVLSSNLPKDVEINDQVLFMGKKWTVMSVGYYFDEARFVNPGIMNNTYIASRCPKGLNLQ